MIDDKSLDRTILSGAKAGLIVRVEDGMLQVLGDNWAAETPMPRLLRALRETLGSLVTILGTIPEEGDCFKIWKTKGEYTVQDVMGDTVSRALLDGEEERELLATPLSWGPWKLWQTKSGTIVGQTASAMGMMDMPAALDTLGAMRWVDYSTGERVACEPYIPDDPDKRALWKALEAVRWVWKEEPEG